MNHYGNYYHNANIFIRYYSRHENQITCIRETMKYHVNHIVVTFDFL